MSARSSVRTLPDQDPSGICRQDSRTNSFRSLAVVLVIAICAGPIGALSAEPAGNTVRSGYAQVDDIRIYHEVRGAGEPIIMLHGGFGTTLLWTTSAELLAKRFLVITADARGRGRTSDGDGPITPGRTARDVIGLMDHLDLRQAHIVGHSAGSVTAVHLLIDYPDRVRSATLVGSPLIALAQPNAALRKQMSDVKSAGRGLTEDPEMREFAEQWRKLAPDPSRFSATMEKLSRVAGVGYGESTLFAVNRPVLVVKAGRDALIPPESFDRLAAAIPGAALIDFPEGTHRLPRQEAARLALEIQKFIDALPLSTR